MVHIKTHPQRHNIVRFWQLGKFSLFMGNLTLGPNLLKQIRTSQLLDNELTKIRKEVENGTQSNFHISTDGILKFRDRICIPNDAEQKRVILSKAHQSLYTLHPVAPRCVRIYKKTTSGTG
jgi:hypothetical protein